MYPNLEDKFNLEKFCTDKYLIQMQSQAKSSGIKLPEVHGVRKKFRSQSETRKTAYLTQTRIFGKATYRSRECQIKEEET